LRPLLDFVADLSCLPEVTGILVGSIDSWELDSTSSIGSAAMNGVGLFLLPPTTLVSLSTFAFIGFAVFPLGYFFVGDAVFSFSTVFSAIWISSGYGAVGMTLENHSM
jgi:hypothetical protein